MKFTDIPKFPRAFYRVNVSLDFLKEHLEHWDHKEMGSPLIMNPEWQRGHVWSKEQQIAFMEYFLKGGTMGSEVYFNCSTWQGKYNTPIYCVDGLQRISAALAFCNNEIPVFGHYLKDFEDRLRMADVDFIFNVLKISNKKELLGIYLNFNSAGTVHSQAELDKVQHMIDNTPETETL
jgi:uncharacterized protein with ParB-like and HNH nuclease domain